jgi:hypothetical protein
MFAVVDVDQVFCELSEQDIQPTELAEYAQ